MARKAPITHEQFFQHAQNIEMTTAGGRTIVATVKPEPSKSSGSVGWLVNEKFTVNIDGIDVPVIFSGNITVIGSKTEKSPENAAA